MIKHSLAATILAVGLVTVAHANLSTNPPTPRTETAEPRLDPSRSYAENKAFVASSISDGAVLPSAGKRSPRTIALPGADTPDQGYAAPQPTSQPAAAAAPRPERLSETRPAVLGQELNAGPTPAARPTVETAREAAAAPARSAGANRSAGYRAAKWSGGEGATWKTGRDAYGFSGLIGGCRIVGSVGSHGYRLDRAC